MVNDVAQQTLDLSIPTATEAVSLPVAPVAPRRKRGRPKGSGKATVKKAVKAQASVAKVQPKAEETESFDHPLAYVFAAAILQATEGKGVRHGGASIPFFEQPWAHYAKMHGRGFLTGQAAKKLEEAATTKEGEAFVQEMLGAMVYIGMAILVTRGVDK